MEEWPSLKRSKLISKSHPRAAQESSQICYKITRVFQLWRMRLQTNHRGFSNSGTCALDAQLCPQVTLGSREPIKGS